MYKISINETPLFFINKSEIALFPENSKETLVAPYMGKSKILLSYADMLEKGSRHKQIVLYADDAKSIFRDFKGFYARIGAAGGLVFNENGQILVIHRLGYWDLPKGKIDPGEGKKEAAIREVQEETGIENLELGNKIMKTYHTYKDRRKNRILKKTHWYIMNTQDSQLIPQTEESIELAEWKDPAEFLRNCRPVYNTIKDVVTTGIKNL